MRRTLVFFQTLVGLIALASNATAAHVDVPDYAAMKESLQAGDLSAVEYVTLVIQALNDPGSLEVRWMTVERDIDFCLTPIIKDIERVARGDPAAQEALKGLRSRPLKQATFVSPDGLFNIHYDTTGTHAVLDPDIDVNPVDGVPDYVNRCAESFDYSWHFQVDTLGYDPTGSDYGLGGSDNYDVYIHHNPGAGGMTYPDIGLIPPEYDPERPDARCTHIHVDPTMEEFAVLEDPLPMLMATSAHELHHGIQGVYDWVTTEPWAEQTAVWMEEVIHDDLDPYIKYFEYCSLVGYPSYLDQPHRYLYTYSDMIHYTAFVWPLFLEHQFGQDFMRQTWVELISPAVGEVQAVEIVLQSHGSSYAEGVPEFQVWNYFTGERDDGFHYEEGDSLPLIHIMTEHTTFPVIDAGSIAGELPQGYGCNYIEFPELSGINHLRIRFSDGNTAVRDWEVSFIRYHPDTSDVNPMTIENGEGESILYADEFSTIVMISSSKEETENYFDYSYSVWANEYVLFEEFWSEDLGDGDGRLEAGETFSIGASFYSIAADWENAALTVSTDDSDLEIIQNQATGESASPGETFDIPAGSILLSVANDLQGAHLATIQLHVGPAGEDPVRTFEADILLGIPPHLLVDDDGGDTIESFITASLDSLELLYDVWDDEAQMFPAYPLASLDFTDYDSTIIWITGDAGNCLDQDDIIRIESILGNNGHLLLSGQDIAESLSASSEGIAFMEEWLDVQYEGFDNSFRLLSMPGDTLFTDDVEFVTAGSIYDGANNQTSRDRLIPHSEAPVCLQYQSGSPAAIRREWDSGSARLLFTGFGIEAIVDDYADADSRQAFLSIALDWLIDGLDTDENPVPDQLRITRVWPNPSSGVFQAQLALPGVREELKVSLVNLAGRRVSKLYTITPWNSNDTTVTFRIPRAVSNGIYLLRVADPETWRMIPVSVIR